MKQIKKNILKRVGDEQKECIQESISVARVEEMQSDRLERALELAIWEHSWLQDRRF